MTKSRIIIASTNRTLALAEQLCQQLNTDYCEASLWSEDRRHDPTTTIYEALGSSATRYDFAVVVLAKEEVIGLEVDEKQRARDNCVFEAGLFGATIGPERCFIASSVAQNDLPLNLRDLQFLSFEQPSDLFDGEECSQAVETVSKELKHTVQLMENRLEFSRLPLLSFEDLFSRELLHFEGGDLHEGQVVVCDIQTHTEPEFALQVFRNITKGISYLYFLYFSEDVLNKLIQGLQVLATGIIDTSGKVADFNARFELIGNDQEKVLEGLRSICQTRSLIISFLPTAPQFRFRVHNATDPRMAHLYLRHRANGYLAWDQGDGAVSLWEDLPRYMSIDGEERFFVPLKHFHFENDQKKRFRESLDRALNRYFPGMQDEVRQLCLGAAANE